MTTPLLLVIIILDEMTSECSRSQTMKFVQMYSRPHVIHYEKCYFLFRIKLKAKQNTVHVTTPLLLVIMILDEMTSECSRSQTIKFYYAR